MVKTRVEQRPLELSDAVSHNLGWVRGWFGRSDISRRLSSGVDVGAGIVVIAPTYLALVQDDTVTGHCGRILDQRMGLSRPYDVQQVPSPDPQQVSVAYISCLPRYHDRDPNAHKLVELVTFDTARGDGTHSVLTSYHHNDLSPTLAVEGNSLVLRPANRSPQVVYNF